MLWFCRSLIHCTSVHCSHVLSTIFFVIAYFHRLAYSVVSLKTVGNIFPFLSQQPRHCYHIPCLPHRSFLLSLSSLSLKFLYPILFLLPRFPTSLETSSMEKCLKLKPPQPVDTCYNTTICARIPSCKRFIHKWHKDLTSCFRMPSSADCFACLWTSIARRYQPFASIAALTNVVPCAGYLVC